MLLAGSTRYPTISTRDYSLQALLVAQHMLRHQSDNFHFNTASVNTELLELWPQFTCPLGRVFRHGPLTSSSVKNDAGKAVGKRIAKPAHRAKSLQRSNVIRANT